MIKKGESKITPAMVKSLRVSHFNDLRRRYLSLHNEAMKRLDELEAYFVQLEKQN